MDQRQHLSRLRWRCRRGMRELDVLLERFLEQAYPHASNAEQLAFEELLTLPDPEILALLTGRSRPQDQSLAHVVERLSAQD
jgi:antitoxin CptB